MPDVTAPEIDETAWYSHCLLLAQSCFGKTNTIQWRIEQLLPKVAAGAASLVVMEPKSVLIDALMRLPEVHEKIVLLGLQLTVPSRLTCLKRATVRNKRLPMRLRCSNMPFRYSLRALLIYSAGR